MRTSVGVIGSEHKLCTDKFELW